MRINVMISVADFVGRFGAKAHRTAMAEARILGQMLQDEGYTHKDVPVRVGVYKCKSHIEPVDSHMADYMRVKEIVDRAHNYTLEIAGDHWYHLSHIDTTAEIVK